MAAITSEKEPGVLNKLAALATMSTGSGFSQEEEKFSMLNVPYMSKKPYAKYEKAAGDLVISYVKETMEKSLAEEKELCERRGDKTGSYYDICATVDGAKDRTGMATMHLVA